MAKYCSGKSAGAIVKKKDKILLLDRVFFPLGWACPAGHIKRKESPLQALIRETKEETGLKPVKVKLILRKKGVPNKCRQGTKFHDWWIFECRAQGKIKLNRKEAKDFGWFSPAEIKNLKLEPIWKHWFFKLHEKLFSNYRARNPHRA